MDVLLAAAKVGDNGRVIGLDMSEVRSSSQRGHGY